jgi:hypothetical protein
MCCVSPGVSDRGFFICHLKTIYMNFIKKLFSKPVPAVNIQDPMMRKTVIHFTKHEFDYIGYIKASYHSELYEGKSKLRYLIQVLKGSGGEARDSNLINSTESVSASDLQQLSDSVYICYD